MAVTYQVRQGHRVLARASDKLTVGPWDGTSTFAPAPVLPRVIASGQPVTVSYDLAGVTTVSDPELVVSAVGHWNPTLGPVSNAAYSVPLSGLTGTVTLPAKAFGDGGGIYGVGIEQDSDSGVYSAFVPVRDTGFPARFAAVARPTAPLLAGDGTAPGHAATVSRAHPDFRLDWNAGRRAAGAILEISAPAPTVDGSAKTVGNPNGMQRDEDGFDTGSVVYKKLPAAESRTFSTLRLGLATSLSYDVRILPAGRSSAVAGQASPTSLLTVNDGLAPDGDIVDNFVIAGASSVVSIVGADGAQVVHYHPATGTYGSVVASDDSGGQFYVFGVDPAAHTVLVDDVQTASDGSTTDDVELYDTRTGTLVGAPDLSGYTLKGGLVDAAHHRADLLADDQSSGDDTVIAVSMTTGAVSTAIDADGTTARSGSLRNLAVDDATGEVYATAGPGSPICLGSGTALAEVHPGAGTATVTTGGTACDDDLAVDSAAGNLISANYRSVSVNFAGSSSLVVMPEAKPSADSVCPLRTGAPLQLAADPMHHLALVLYALPAGPAKFGALGGIAVTDSNAMSVIESSTPAPGTSSRRSATSAPGPSTAIRSGAAGSSSARPPGPGTCCPGDTQIQQFCY